MLDALVVHGLQYTSYALELSLVMVLATRGWWRKHFAFFLYLSGFAFIDALLRPVVLYTYGWTSQQYLYCYWISDLVLTLGAFLFISELFRRACHDNKTLWKFLRTTLVSVFVLMALISSYTVWQHDHTLARYFVVELTQNVYFSCLVLNTLLYVMLQRADYINEDLSLIVCGLGIEFAGPAASMALAHLLSGWSGSIAFASLIAQFCNVGMLTTWLYAVAKAPEERRVRSYEKVNRVPAFAEVRVNGIR